MLSVHDVECLCTGAGILGCGGGGSPYLGELLAKKEISEGKEIKVVNPFRSVRMYSKLNFLSRVTNKKFDSFSLCLYLHQFFCHV